MSCRASTLYQHLSGMIHPGDMQVLDRVLLVEGPLNPEQMRFLKCVADAVECPCELRYLQEASMEGE